MEALTNPNVLLRCDACDFTVPLDKVGAALMDEHLREHDNLDDQ